MNPEYTSQSIEHLGMVSAMFDELGIAEIINTKIPQDPQRLVSAGQAIKAMVLNGLGFSQRRLYLEPNLKPKKQFILCPCTPNTL